MKKLTACLLSMICLNAHSLAFNEKYYLMLDRKDNSISYYYYNISIDNSNFIYNSRKNLYPLKYIDFNSIEVHFSSKNINYFNRANINFYLILKNYDIKTGDFEYNMFFNNKCLFHDIVKDMEHENACYLEFDGKSVVSIKGNFKMVNGKPVFKSYSSDFEFDVSKTGITIKYTRNIPLYLEFN